MIIIRSIMINLIANIVTVEPNISMMSLIKSMD